MKLVAIHLIQLKQNYNKMSSSNNNIHNNNKR
jgi:hypothetical protein